MSRTNGFDRMAYRVTPALHTLLSDSIKVTSSVHLTLHEQERNMLIVTLFPFPFRCSETSKCQICTRPNHPCSPQYPHEAWKIKQHGTVSHEGGMISALQDGPIVCGMAVTERFERVHNFEVYRDESSDVDPKLAVSIVGYGVTDGRDPQKYWVCGVRMRSLQFLYDHILCT